MTVALERQVKARRGRELVPEKLFKHLVDFCADEYGLEHSMADRIMDQGLAFLWVMGTTRTEDTLAPSKEVDPAWHTFILHSIEYTDWCHENFGRFLHHMPNSKVRTRGLMVSVVDRIKDAGFEVDERLWHTAAECNEPTCCGDGPCC
ncbi:glycine-rich domain-containing protein [Streptomyces sp. NPDC002851]